LNGTLDNGDVYVICHGDADPAIKVHSDLQSSILNFNGNDAIGLAETNYAGGWTLIDSVGTDGTNAPAIGWDVAGTNAATADHTLIRKGTIRDGTTNWATSAGTTVSNSQWVVLPGDTITNLGFHGTAPEEPPFIMVEQDELTVLVHSHVTFNITVGDFNNDEITLSNDSPPPDGGIFTPSLNQVGTPILTNTFSWTPDTPGDYPVDYLATDDDGSVTSTVMIHVSGVLPPPERVWINEIHYEDSRLSAQEEDGVEIAGIAGVDLSTYRIYPYDGNDTWESAKTFTLSNTIPYLQGGYGTVWFDSPSSLENSEEGLALARIEGGVTTIVQFISYEGDGIAAANGPAQGFLSTDIGVSESSSTAPSNSLQLIGSGNVYADFSWTGPIADTRGAVNTGQTFKALPTLLVVQ